jgi:hypothetical protein
MQISILEALQRMSSANISRRTPMNLLHANSSTKRQRHESLVNGMVSVSSPKYTIHVGGSLAVSKLSTPTIQLLVTVLLVPEATPLAQNLPKSAGCSLAML